MSDQRVPLVAGEAAAAAAGAGRRPPRVPTVAPPDTPCDHSARWQQQLLACAAALVLVQGRLQHAQETQRAVREALAQSERALCSVRRELAAARGRERLAMHMAQHDGLTQLPNRAGFRRRVSAALDAARGADRRCTQGGGTLAVLFLDLDGMKAVNDHHGHLVGDQLLRTVARRLARSIRSEDMVCRLGGDEFACLLSQPMSQRQLEGLAQKLYTAVSAPMQLGGQVLSVSPSIGIAVDTHEAHTVDELLVLADTAMYQAKRLRLGHAFHPSVALALPVG